MLEKIIIFILFLGPLVFFHELGHFLFARLFGVRVEVFSIGFGPKLFRKKWGETEYALSLIPLGGYVKMFGDDPLNKDSIPEGEKHHSFTHQSKWARFWIVLGGPLANFILAFSIFYALLISGERVPEIQMGHIPSTSLVYETGLREGDKILQMNGRDVVYLSDLMPKNLDDEINLSVDRFGETIQLRYKGDSLAFFKELSKYPLILRRPVLVSSKGEIFWANGDKTISLDDTLEEFRYRLGQQDEVYLHSITEKNPQTAKELIEKGEFKTIKVEGRDFGDIIDELQLAPLEMEVHSVQVKSSAANANLKKGDIIFKVAGDRVYDFEELKMAVQRSEGREISISYWRDGKAFETKLTPKIEEDGVTRIGVHSNMAYRSVRFVQTPSKGFFGSFVFAFERLKDSTVKVFDGFINIATQKVSFKEVGGPISIGKVASDSFNTSLSYFFQIMAFISINLGVINLFPIPVLDGGHLMFIALELVNGGPLSRRKMEIAQQLGLSLLLMLIIGSIFNDVTRHFF